MVNFDIYNDIAERTGGDIYLGLSVQSERKSHL